MSVASVTLLRCFLLFDQKHDIDEVTAFPLFFPARRKFAMT